MILRIGRVRVRPGMWDAFEAAYREMLEQGGEAPGAEARWLARDADDENRASTVGIWESEEAVAAWLASATHREAAERMASFFDGDYEVHVSEVVHAVRAP